MRKVMVFGVFDGVHVGHAYFFKEAKKFGDILIVALARDGVVRKLKNRSPLRKFSERKKEVLLERGVDKVIAGDRTLGAWEVVKKHRPETIALGYDQKFLKKDLEKHIREFAWHPRLKVIAPHKPEKYHASIISRSKAPKA